MVSKITYTVLLWSIGLLLVGQQSSSLKLKGSGINELESLVHFSGEKPIGYNINEWKSSFDLKAIFSPKSTLHSNALMNISNIEGRRFFSLRELNYQYRGRDYNIKIGKQIIDWGSLTGWSIMDLPNNFKYFDFIDTYLEEQGLWAISGSLYYNDFEVNLKISPFFSPSHLYLQTSRWIELPTELPTQDVTFPSIPLKYSGINEIKEFKGPQLGISISKDLGQWSTAINLFHGYNDIPNKSLILKIDSTDVMDTIDYQVDLIYSDITTLSFQFATFISDWNVWGEMAYTRSKRMGEGDLLESYPFYTFSAGTDKVFEFEDPEQQIKLLLQYIYSFNTAGITYDADDLNHIFNNAILADVGYRHNYNWSFNLRAALEFDRFGMYLYPNVSRRLNNQFKFLAGLEILRGSSDGFFGFYNENSRLRVAIRHYY
ncbi:MAG: hypothetical protein HKN68_02110 [Saprospiraceae bacterium]|nr:hypothetical protein [Saprospiraceae bacterium]